MRYTLLELTTRILESLESDEVDSISDTEEAMTVANIIKECYYEIIGRVDLPEKEDIYQLQASGDNTLPTIMYLPSFAIDLKKLKYNSDETTGPAWYDVRFIPFEEFLNMTSALDTDATNVDTLDRRRK